MKYLWRNKLLLIVLIIVVLMFPTTISLPQQSRSENIITAVGIDKIDDEYEVTLQYLIPDASSSQNSLKVSSLKGKSVADAMEKINLNFGKVGGFAHCRVLVFNNDAGNENLFNNLDYFQKNKVNTNNILLVHTKKSAKDLLSSVENLNSDFYVILSRYSVEDKHNQYQALKTIGEYYNEMLGENKTIAINSIDVESGEQESEGSDSSSESPSSDSSQSSSKESSTNKNNKIKNNGELCILKNDKIIETLDSEQSRHLSWFSKKIKDMTLKIENFSDETFQNTDIIFDIFKKKVTFKAGFRGIQPIFKVCLNVNANIVECKTNKINEKEYKIDNRRFSKKLIGTIKNQILKEMIMAEQKFVDEKYDVVHCNEYFYKFCNKKYKDFLSKLSSKDDFISRVKFEYLVNVNQWN